MAPKMNTLNGNTQSKINQDEINAVLWKACDTFRGTIDPSEYKNYILVMLFLKYISDVWKEHYGAERVRSGTDDDALIRRRLRHERFVLPPACDFDTLYAKRNTAESLGEEVNVALEAIETHNKEKLEGVFPTLTSTARRHWGAPASAMNGSRICWRTSTTRASTCAPHASAIST
jgi:type I restriction enzyme M protein